MQLRVLIVDDDQRLYDLLSSYLEKNGVMSEHARDGLEALQLAHAEFDAIILDVMMPGMDGLTTLRKLRERSGIPILMLTAKGDEADRIVGLELGADDYLSKPFSPRELLARLRAILRRGQPASTAWVKVNDVELSTSQREVRAGGSVVELTGLEFDLLAALMARPGRVVSRASLLELAGRTDTVVNDRTVDVHISHIRKKLGAPEQRSRLIRTVRGVGYVLGESTD